MKALEELRRLVLDAGAHYTEEELMRAINGKGSIRCNLLPSWSIRDTQICLREAECHIKGRVTGDVRCALRLVKIAGELRKKHWLEEVL